MSKYKTVQEAVTAAYEALHEAEFMSDETGEGFGFYPCYGMGGFYDPTEVDEDTGSNWYPSSLSC